MSVTNQSDKVISQMFGGRGASFLKPSTPSTQSEPLSTIPTGASDLAEEYGLSQMAKEGLGYAWQQDFVRSALGRSFDYGGMMEQGGTSLVNQGLLYSGAIDATLPSEVAGAGQQIASDAYVQGGTQSDDVAQRAQSMELQLAQHTDRMTLEYDMMKQQLEAGERNWWDHTIGAMSIASNLVGVGQGVGLLNA